MRRRLLPLLTVVAASLLALALFELMLRGTGFSAPVWYQPDAQLGWTLRPGLSAWQTREGQALVETNAAGWRDREHPVAKPPGVFRIVVLGDSYSEAVQVAREDTFWAQLPEKLAACGFAPAQQIEVLNFGVSGYGTAQEYLVLESQAQRYQPDLVLMQFTNGNDVRNNSLVLETLEQGELRPFYRLEPDGSLRLDASFANTPTYLQRASPVRAAFRTLTDASRVLQLLRQAASQPLITTVKADTAAGPEQGLEPVVLSPPTDRRWEEAWQITEGLLARSHEFARRHGMQFIVATVPYAIQVHPDARVRAEWQSRLGVTDLFYPDHRLMEFSKHAGIDTVALAPEMQRIADERGTYFHGFRNSGIGRGHWNSDGHRTGAYLIARHLCKARR